MAETEYHYVAARNASVQETKVHEHDDNNLPGPTTKRRARVKYDILNGRTGTSGRCPSLQHVAALEMVDVPRRFARRGSSLTAVCKLHAGLA